MLSLLRVGQGYAISLWLALLSTPAFALTPDDAVARALEASPSVRAAEARLLEARGELAERRLLLYNPQARIGLGLVGDRVEAGLGQPLSLSGEGFSARDAARAAVAAAEAALGRARLEAATEVRALYATAVARREAAALAAEGAALATRLQEAVARQLEAGEAARLDLLLARMGTVEAAAAVVQARAEEAEALSALAARLGVEATALELAEDPLVAVPEARAPVQARADLAAARARVEAAEAELRRARASALPPVGLGFFLEQEPEGLVLGPELSLTLPLFDRSQGERGAARGALAEAEAQETALQAVASTERALAEAREAEARRLAEVAGAGAVEAAREALGAIEAGYRGGEIDLPSAVLLQSEVLAGMRATVALRLGLAEARLDLLLATEDPALLAGGAE